MDASLDGNATLFRERRLQLAGADLAALRTVLSTAIAERVPGASVTDLSAIVVENSTRINVTAFFTVGGSARNAGSSQRFDLSWRSLVIDAVLASGNVSYNRVGAAYLRPLFKRVANDTGIQFNLNRTIIISEAQAMNMGGNFTLFDFKPLSVPLTQWSRRYDASHGVTVMTFRSQPTLDITVRTGPKEGQGVYRFSASVNGKIIAPGLVLVEDDSVSLERGTAPYVALMSLLVVLPLLGLVILHVGRPRSSAGRRGGR